MYCLRSQIGRTKGRGRESYRTKSIHANAMAVDTAACFTPMSAEVFSNSLSSSKLIWSLSAMLRSLVRSLLVILVFRSRLRKPWMALFRRTSPLTRPPFILPEYQTCQDRLNRHDNWHPELLPSATEIDVGRGEQGLAVFQEASARGEFLVHPYDPKKPFPTSMKELAALFAFSSFIARTLYNEERR
jgi:hypothetical protein